MPLDITSLRAELDAEQRERRRRPAILSGSFQEPEESPEMGLLARAGDALIAPVRGLEGAAQDLYGLADAVAFDALPNWEERLFGESKTLVGGLIEGATNFAAGFVPVYGWVGKAGRVGRFLSKSPILKGAVAGAVADFAVFDGHEARLSDLIQSVPALENPITEFLASDEDDPELVGRFKAVVEGLGIGAAVDGLILGVKALRAGRKVRAEGGSPRQVEEAVEEVMAEPLPKERPESVTYQTSSGSITVKGADAVETFEASAREAAAAGRPLSEPAAVDPAVPQIADVPPPAADGVEILRTFDLTKDDAEALLAHGKSREALNLDPHVNPRDLSPAERVVQNMQRTDLNMSRYRGPEAGAQIFRAMEQLLEPFSTHAKTTAKSLDEQQTEALRYVADVTHDGRGLDANMQSILAQAQKDSQDLPGIMRRLLAYRASFDGYGRHLNKLASTLQFPGQATDLARLQFAEAMDTFAEMGLMVKGLSGEAGRGLGALRTPTFPVWELLTSQEAREGLAKVGGAKRLDDLAAKVRMVYEAGGVPGVMDLARAGRGKRAWAVLNEYWYNSLLGRPTTLVVNAMSSALTAIYRPLELMIGGTLAGKGDAIADGVRELSGLMQSVSESFTAMRASVKAGGNLLDPARAIADIVDPTKRAITARTFGADDKTIGGAAINWLGRLVRFPSAVLMATDELAKNLNYRAVARAQLTKEAIAKGLSPEDAAKHVTMGLDRLIYQGQAYSSAQLYHRGVEDAVRAGKKTKAGVEEHARAYVDGILATGEHQKLSQIHALARDRAEEATFTKALTPGSVAYRLQEAVLAHPYLRLVMPFVRTPVNIAVFAGQRLDVPGMVRGLAGKRFPRYAQALESSRNRMVMDLLSDDPRRAADAMGRLATGMGITSVVLLKAAELDADGLPTISGRGPADKERRSVLEAAGWQPYSIRVGNKYISYQRLDPFSSIIGTAADILDTAREADGPDQEEVEALGWGLAVGLASNFTNKTYLAGLANFMDALSDPQRKVPVLFNTLGASFVPGQLAASVSASDPYMRDVQSMNDALRARVPGASETLPPRRNMLGEPVRRAQSLGSGASSIFNAFVPILYREVSDDLIAKELRGLEHGFTPPRRERNGVDLSSFVSAGGQTAYDRWLELHGTTELGGKTLRQSLQKLIRSKGYQQIPAQSTHELASPRIQLINNVLNDYRHAAYRQMVREFPEIAELERQRVTNRRALLAGREQRPNLLQQLGGR